MLTFFEWWCIITFVSCESNRQGTRRWRNRQTRRLQVPVVATSCGFKSHSPHRSPVSVDTGFFYVLSKADIRNPSLQLCWQGLASLLAHERSRFAICQWELSTPTDISIPLTRRLVLRALEAGDAYLRSRMPFPLQICFWNKKNSPTPKRRGRIADKKSDSIPV